MQGRILWTDETQQNNEQFLCGGYIVTEGNGTFNLSLSSLFKTAFIFIKANNAVHPSLGMRVFGGLHRDSSLGYSSILSLLFSFLNFSILIIIINKGIQKWK